MSSMYAQSVQFYPGICGLTASFQTELAINTHTMVADIHRNVVTGEEGVSGQNRSVGATRYPQTMECLLSPRLELGK